MMFRKPHKALAVAALVFIMGCSAKTDSPSSFDGERAFSLLKKQCDFGPRYPGIKAHEDTADFIVSELKGKADQVTVHQFDAKTGRKTLHLKNIYAVFNPKATRFVLLAAHWDTRPTADMEVDPKKAAKPIIGANDGASGVAVLLELANSFKAKSPKIGVVMAFIDGEDYGPGEADMYFGSEELAKNYRKNSFPIDGRPVKFEYGILLDMVGAKGLQIPREVFSQNNHPTIMDKVWGAAKITGHAAAFPDRNGHEIRDDHVPLTFAGIKCIDLIDFDYGPWHTLEDTPDKCSAQSLQIVGNVVSQVVYSEK